MSRRTSAYKRSRHWRLSRVDERHPSFFVSHHHHHHHQLILCHCPAVPSIHPPHSPFARARILIAFLFSLVLPDALANTITSYYFMTFPLIMLHRIRMNARGVSWRWRRSPCVSLKRNCCIFRANTTNNNRVFRSWHRGYWRLFFVCVSYKFSQFRESSDLSPIKIVPLPLNLDVRWCLSFSYIFGIFHSRRRRRMCV